MKKTLSQRNRFISPKAAQQALRRRLPALMKKLNAMIRNGRRWFGSNIDFEPPFMPLVHKALINAGWEVSEEKIGMGHTLSFRAKNEKDIIRF